ncbi:MAG: hypothetical protein JO360_13010, partial [Acidobacteria bacterium]|nr:hypothetical protein [Acidobacteriota bacterium]
IGLAQQRLTTDKTVEAVAGRVVTYTDASGNAQSLSLPEKERLSVRELVVYPIARAGGGQPLLEFHVAWEIFVDSAPALSIYVDSITGDILGAERKEAG